MSLDLHPSDYSIFIVDSEESSRKYLQDNFQRWGFQVKAFADGDKALEFMKTGELPHVMFADVHVKGLSGVGLTKRVKEMSQDVEVVFMTSSPSIETALDALRLGVHDYLLKPFDKIEDVRKVIFHVCERVYLRLYNEYLSNELKIKNQEIRGLSNLADELTEVVDVSKTIEIGCRYLSNAFGKSDACFLQFIPKEMSLMVASRYPETLFGGAQSKLLIPKESTVDMKAVIEYFKNIEKDEHFSEMLVSASRMSSGGQEKKGWRAFPFVTRGLPRGVFVLHAPYWDDEIERPLAQRYVQALEKYFENALLHKKVFEMSVKDGLTGLYNVRAFRERLAQELLTAERIQHPLSFIFFDVDHFKKYNDTNGHPAGDFVLKTVADLLRKNFRSTDFIARYGGEEFCVIMPHTDLKSALAKAEEFRKVVEQHDFPHKEKQPLGKVSVSIGVSEFPSLAGNAERIVKIADEALYNAKKQSRNVVVCAEKDPNHIPSFESKHVSVSK